MKKFIIDNTKTLIFALIIAVFIRSILIQPFYIPSSSMEPNLLVGDRLFVTKFSYGYSKHSFPFSPPILNGRVLSDNPERGDVVVFKTPADNRTDYIKRLIGLPGDVLQFIDGDLYLNNNQINGELPVELGYCSELEYLQLQNNQINGEFPPSICELELDWQSIYSFNVSNYFLCPPYPTCFEDVTLNQNLIIIL